MGELAADRAAFICQSQSLNVHIAEPTNGKLTSMHFYAWKKGLKTGMYYLRTRPKANAIQFTVRKESLAQRKTTSITSSPDSPKKVQDLPQAIPDEEVCLNCGA